MSNNDSFSVGNYIVEREEIGKGSSAVIFKGVNRLDKKTYALKRIKFGDENKMKAYVENEISIMKKIRHINIVMLYDTVIDTANKYIYLILEYCEKGDFYKFQNHKPIAEMHVQKYMRQLIRALQYLYDIHNIVHRDIKPQNLLMGVDGNIKLADFGFAKTVKPNEENPLTSTICGTPLYMAPEILNGHGTKYNTKISDLWSVGVIMYEMLVGHTPYTGRNLFELKNNVKNEITLPINVVVSTECKDLLYSLLQGSPAKRIKWEKLFEHPWFKRDLLEELENKLLAFDINDDAKLPSIETFEKDRKMFGSIELTKSENNRFNESTDASDEMFYSVDSEKSTDSNNSITQKLKDAIESDFDPYYFDNIDPIESKLHTRLDTQPLRDKVSEDLNLSFDMMFDSEKLSTSISTSLTIDDINISHLSTSGKFTIINSPPNRVTKSDTSHNRTTISLTKMAKNSWNILKNSMDYVGSYGKSI